MMGTFVRASDRSTMTDLTMRSRISANTSANLITDPSLLAGYNTYVLAFWTTYAPTKPADATGGPMDSLEAWVNLTSSDRAAMKKKFHDAGIRITFTCFGGMDDHTTWSPEYAQQVAVDVAAFTQQYDLDGVDIDYEAFNYAATDPVDTMLFLTTLTTTLRQNLPRPYMLTYSVWPRWFAAGDIWSSRPESVASQDMDDIDYVNAMFYGGPNIWDTCTELMTDAGTYPGTSFGEIVAQGTIPANKLLVGRQMYGTNASDRNGTMVGECLKGHEVGGVATWQYYPNFPNYIGDLRAAAGI